MDGRQGRKYRLGDLQLKIMKVLWQVAPASVAEVRNQLSGPPLAYTTVATMLRKMEARGLLRHQERGRKFVYEPLISSQDVTRSMADDLVDRLFEGSLAATVSHLLETREVSPNELARLEQLIEQRKKTKTKRT
ncbi:MAG: BlaI/MecI/CopY family transcriptional regulator [Planctomycetota bacterium]